jgi:TolB-like protein
MYFSGTMKLCPKCHREYNDEALNFCLDDGEWLHEATSSDDQTTAVLSSESPTRVHRTDVSLPPGSATTSKQDVPPRRKLIIGSVLSVLVVAAVGLGGYWSYVKRTSKQIDSIAVMPLANESGNPEFEYISDQATETLISSLTKLPELIVKPRSSVIRYKGKDTDVKTLGRDLSVEALLNGSVAQRGGDVALHVELIDVASERVLWSEDYRKPLSAFATLQSEIARDIAGKLQARLSRTDQQQLTRKYTDNPEAYQLYLKGRFHWNKRTKSDMYKAIEYFQQATSLDPNYSQAYAGLADSYLILPGYDRSVSRRETPIKAREYALKALSLDDSLAEAHVAIARVLEYYDFDFIGAEREFKRAMDLDASYALAYQGYGYLLAALGRHDEADANYRKALALEPASPEIYRGYAVSLMLARRYDECEAQLKKAIDLEPNFELTYYSVAGLNILRGRYFEGMEAYARGTEVRGDPVTAAAMRESFAKGGQVGFVRGFTTGKWGTTTPLYVLAGLQLTIGEKEGALASLEKAYEDREPFIILLNVDPRLDALRGGPRFQELVKKVGFSLQ